MLLSTVRSKPLHEIRVGGDSSEEKKNADIGWILKNLGFVRDSHQICVGITRCKYGLVIVGKFYPAIMSVIMISYHNKFHACR